MSEYPWTRQISYLFSSAPFTVPLKHQRLVTQKSCKVIEKWKDLPQEWRSRASSADSLEYPPN